MRRGLASALVFATLGWGIAQGFASWRYRVELARAEREMGSRQYQLARATLAGLASRWPGQADIEYALGSCESQLGHVEAALAAWNRVRRPSSLAAPAALARARLALEHGRLAAAEQSLARILNEPGQVGDEAGKLSERLYFLSGRSEAISRSIEGRFGAARDQAGLLRTHWLLDSQPVPIIALRESLEKMLRESPDDDRLWLGFADLELRSGHHEEADRWLKRCEARRPDDPDVRHARLKWALAMGRPNQAMELMKQIPSDGVSSRDLAALEVQLAVLRSDVRAERAALERQLELDPGHPAAWERLAEIAASAGELDRSALLRKRKAEIDRARDDYRKLMGTLSTGGQSQLAGLGRTAERLGRWFEARGWWTLRALEAADDRDARCARSTGACETGFSTGRPDACRPDRRWQAWS